ncbi:MAG: protein translocase subunit SecF [Deltaproteobacteria bacterium]|nr:protein translocase subunit SecF [Deltaproteobacteria bacterium]
MEFIKNANFDFMGKRKVFLAISVVIAVVGLVAAAAVPLGKANLGIDFSGGVAVQYKFEKPFKADEVRDALKKGGFPEADIQEFSGTNRLLVRIKGSMVTEGVAAKIDGALKTALPDNPFELDSTTEIGPTVGKRLQKDALWAIVISLLAILAYVWWRFEFRFGVAAIIATFHDVLAVLALFFILGNEINLLVITALLTIAGYSLTDTVVVFDRIRENLRKGSKDDLVPLINRSVNEVLSRTIVTSGTTLIVLIALFFLGGEVIHDFSLALAAGVIVGTYSSIFIASPLLLLWGGSKENLIKKEEPKKEEAYT